MLVGGNGFNQVSLCERSITGWNFDNEQSFNLFGEQPNPLRNAYVGRCNSALRRKTYIKK
jgi:hypothetical protein